MKRRTAREKALQALFHIDLNETSSEEAIKFVLNGKEDDSYLNKLVQGTVEHVREIDEIIQNNLQNWTLARLAKVDLNIMRIAVYELKYGDDVPKKVILNEAIEIAKRFGDENSRKFINGVLSKITTQM